MQKIRRYVTRRHCAPMECTGSSRKACSRKAKGKGKAGATKGKTAHKKPARRCKPSDGELRLSANCLHGSTSGNLWGERNGP